MIDIKKLCEDSHRISAAKGWVALGRSFAATLDLIHSELSEAIEEYRNGHPLDQIYFECKFKEDDGRVTKETVMERDIEQARRTEGKYGRGRDFIDAKPCGIPIELADVAIRIAQECGTRELDLAGKVEEINRTTRRIYGSNFEEDIVWAHYFTSQAWAGRGSVDDQLHNLAMVFAVVLDIDHFPKEPRKPNVRLEEAIQMKQAYNETRPMLHGGKKI